MAGNLRILRTRKSQNNKERMRGRKRIMQQRQRLRQWQKKMPSKTDAGKFDAAL